MKQGKLPEAFFKPRSIAVIGATKKYGFGGGLPNYFQKLGYRENLYLVNPREREIAGLPVYPRLTEVPGDIDLAIIIVPAVHAQAVIKDCLAKGVRAIILESAGFGETGTEGARMEAEIRDLVRGSDARIIGPNCIGVLNIYDQFATSEISFDELRPGSIGVVAQSGVFGNILIDWAPTQDLAFSTVVTIGNRLDVDEVDLMYYFAADDKTRVIVLYLEGVKDGNRFLKAAAEVTKHKPVLVYKSGRTSVGRAAAASHTGSLAGDDTIYEAAFRQCGVIRASSFQELFDLAKVFASEPLLKEKKIGVVTCSGSLGVMAADAAVQLGLEFPQLSPATIEAVRKLAPAWMNVKNPLDVGPSGLFNVALKALLQDDAVHGVIALPVIPGTIIKDWVEKGIALTPEILFGDAQELREWSRHKPLLIHTVGSPFWMDLIRKMFGATFSLVSSPETAARALAALNRYAQCRNNHPAKS